MAHYFDTADERLFTATDLKNYAHCPRIVYYEGCLRDIRPRTYAMDAGDEAHLEERARAKRRTLYAYGLPEGERRFNVRLMSAELGLVGMLDELVIAPGGVFHPVDYKLSDRVTPAAELQVTAYALLVEAAFEARVERGYLFLIGRRELHTVAITAERREQVRAALVHIRQIVDGELMPPPVPPKQRGKCRACEWRRFCNDVT